MIPKIEFRYSSIYDSKYRENFEKKGENYPSPEEILNYTKKINNLWNKKGKMILRNISEITKLNWKEEKIICYVIGKGKCFSDPLTIKIYPDSEEFITNLIHELIHQIQTQNNSKFKKWFEEINNLYINKSRLTKNHILLDAFLSKIIEKLYSKNKLSKIIKKDSESADYKIAWEIVQKEGVDNIIRKFRQINRREK